MRHRKAGRKLSRDAAHRRAVLRNLVTSLFQYEEISTTHAKAKALQPIAERMITLAKRGDLHARRQVLSYIMNKSVAHKLFDQMKDRLVDNHGGCTRILKTGHRRGDNAPLAIIQVLLKHEEKKPAKTAKKGVKKEEKESTKKPTVKTVASKEKKQVANDEKEKAEEP
jgi:large subunit ribosomal protein L17